MNGKRITGLIVFLIGIVLIIFAVYNKNRVAEAKSDINKGTSFFGNNAAGNTVTGVLEGKASQYDTPLKICLYGGIVLVIIGGAVMLFCKSRRRK